MAYTFTDHYRPVRLMLRLDGLIIGIGVGLLLLIYPADLLMELGFEANGPAWTAHLAGSALFGLGVGLLFAASETELRMAPLLAAIVSNGLIAVSLLIAYIEGELSDLTTPGFVLLMVIFVTCLLTAVMPIPYVRGERHQL